MKKQPPVRIDFHPSLRSVDTETKEVLSKLTLKGGMMRSMLTWEEKIPGHRLPVCIAFEKDTIIGWACLSSDLISVYVLSKKRRQGIGSLLVRTLHGAVKRRKPLQAQAHSIAGKRLFSKMQRELPLQLHIHYSAPVHIAPFR